LSFTKQHDLHFPAVFGSFSDNKRDIYRFTSYKTLFFPGFFLHPFSYHIPDIQQASHFLSSLQQHSAFPTVPTIIE
jgi:hypothetical protein